MKSTSALNEEINHPCFCRVRVHLGMGGQQCWNHCCKNRQMGAIQQSLLCMRNVEYEPHTQAAQLGMRMLPHYAGQRYECSYQHQADGADPTGHPRLK